MGNPCLRFLAGAIPPLLLGSVLCVVAFGSTAEAVPAWGGESAGSMGWSSGLSAAHAAAIPAWARKYELECIDCHTAWPKLNEYGREFKTNGYAIPGEKEDLEAHNNVISENLVLDKSFPVSARFIMRPFDKKKDKDVKIRSFHEIEVVIAGRVWKDVAAWVEIEAEDEDGFNVFVEQGVVTWNPMPQANIGMGWAPPFWADPFDTLADGGRRMTRSHKGPLDLRFGARERLRSSSQWISFFGTAVDNRVFYLGGISAGGDDPEGGDAKDGFGRVMVKAIPGVYLGGFVLAGTNETQELPLGFSRSGFYFQIEKGGFNAYGVVMQASDDLLDGSDDSWTVGYVEGFYVIPLQKIPMIVPLVRFDFLDDFTGTNDIAAILNFYLTQNIKAYFEWWQNLSAPDGREKNNRATIQVDLAF